MPARLPNLLFFAAILISPAAPLAPLAGAEPAAVRAPDLELKIRLLEIDLGILCKQYEKVQSMISEAELQAVLAEDQEASLSDAERDAFRAKREPLSRHEKLYAYRQKLLEDAMALIRRLQELRDLKTGKE